MKMTKKPISYLLVFLMVFSSFTILPSEFWGWANVSAVEVTTVESQAQSTYKEGKFYYSIINDNEVELTRCYADSSEVTIPSIITNSTAPELINKKVVAICDYAFSSNRTIRKIDMSACKYLKKIGKNAFYKNTNLSTLLLPDSLEEIGPYAFANCISLTELEFGRKIKKINHHAFSMDETSKVPQLKKVYFKGGNRAIIDDHAFYLCTSLESVTIGNGVEIIGESAFEGTSKLLDVTIGNTVTTIRRKAFPLGNGENKITLGTNLTTLHKNAFYCNSFYYKVDNENYHISADIKLFGNNLITCFQNSFPKSTDDNYADSIKIHCFKDSATHRLIKNKDCGNVIKFIEKSYNIVDLKVNDVSLTDFNKDKKDYFFYAEEITVIEPVFEQPSTKYEITNNNNVYSIKIFDDSNKVINTYTITLKNSSILANYRPTGIKINNKSIAYFKPEKKSYTYYTDDFNNVNIVPEFNQENSKYTVTSKNNVYTLNIFDENDHLVHTYTISLKECGYSVIGDVDLMLEKINSNTVGGNIALPAGTYKVKIAKGSKQFGYGKTVTDACSGLTVSEKYSAFITLKATGGTYKFQFDTKTNKLVIKHDKNLPNEYLTGDLDTILTPLGNRPLSVGTQQLPEGSYKFRLSIGGKGYGYNKVVWDTTAGSLSVNSKYSTSITLNATGGLYTFILNTETNKLIIRHTSMENECKTDVHIAGTFNLTLVDQESTGEYLTMGTGTTYLESGCYTFNVYNYGAVYGSNIIIQDEGVCTLSTQYSSPVILNSSGGYYEFVFHKTMGTLVITRVS